MADLSRFDRFGKGKASSPLPDADEARIQAEERAAVLEHDGGYGRAEADARAGVNAFDMADELQALRAKHAALEAKYASLEADYDEFREFAEERIETLSEAANEAIETLRDEIADYATGEVSCAVDAFDDELSRDLREARSGVRLWPYIDIPDTDDFEQTVKEFVAMNREFAVVKNR